MNKPPPNPARLRLQALLAIPERQRTEEQWDELNELEIMLAPGNREGAPEQGVRGSGASAAGHPRPRGGQRGKGQVKKFHPRPRKGNGR